MKITLTNNKPPIIDIKTFNEKANIIFNEVVIPQIKKYKSIKNKK